MTVNRSANFLLARFPREEYRRLAPLLETVSLRERAVIYEPEGRITHAWFPLTGVVSILMQMHDGTLVEAATVGNEGMVGLPLLIREPTSPYRIIQQVPGDNLRLPAGVLRDLIETSPELSALMQRYCQSVLQQTAQTAACNLLHPVEKRLCRWLLMTHDRAAADEFYLTQEVLSIMLGVHRQSVSLAAGALQQAGFISYRRGHVRIENRAGLEAASCECYQASRASYARFFPRIDEPA